MNKDGGRYHASNFQQSAVGYSRWPVLKFGIVDRNKIHWHHHCRPSIQDWTLPFSDDHSHISSFEFSLTVTLFLCQFKNYKLNWIERNVNPTQYAVYLKTVLVFHLIYSYEAYTFNAQSTWNLLADSPRLILSKMYEDIWRAFNLICSFPAYILMTIIKTTEKLGTTGGHIGN